MKVGTVVLTEFSFVGREISFPSPSLCVGLNAPESTRMTVDVELQSVRKLFLNELRAPDDELPMRVTCSDNHSLFSRDHLHNNQCLAVEFTPVRSPKNMVDAAYTTQRRTDLRSAHCCSALRAEACSGRSPIYSVVNRLHLTVNR